MRICDRTFLSVFLPLFAAACGGSSGSTSTVSDSSGVQQSAVTFALAEADSDELESFVVQLEAVRLERVDGASVGVLQQPTTVDLVALEEVGQVLAEGHVPAGLYDGATVRVDFTDARAVLIGASQPATILDVYGHALTGTVELPVTLADPFVAAVGARRLLELDFDLDLSVQVDEAANSVTVEPMLAVRIDPGDALELLLTGELVDVDGSEPRFRMEVQTFFGLPLGYRHVHVAGDAVFQVDGVASGSADGLTALDALGAGTWVQVRGELDWERDRFTATYVEAGAGTYNGGDDIVEGYVVGRTGGAGADAVLSVLGHSNDATHTQFHFNTVFTVSASFADTAVLQRGSAEAFDLDDVGIGQRVRVFGKLNGLQLDAAMPGDVLRLERTHVSGFARGGVQSGVLELDLSRVGLRDAADFAWGDGGGTDPDAARIAVGALGDGLLIGAGSAVEVEGLFAGLDGAGGDFTADSLTNRDTGPSTLRVEDLASGFDVTTTATADEIRFVITGDAAPLEAAELDRGFLGRVDLPRTPAPTVRSTGGGHGIYSVWDRGRGKFSVHLAFEDLTEELDTLLGRGAVLRSLSAFGTYDPAANSMDSGLVSVVLE